ncbi:MAG: phosphate signaling complex protein PhoU [Phycisphaerales bacterium]|nr:phosphate signaling complex protein PhoU [Phycisphaerales bacterium]
MPDGAHNPRDQFEQHLSSLRRRLAREAASAVEMLEEAVEALFMLDAIAAQRVRDRDDSVDEEEVRIEEECFRMLYCQSPVARDFRQIAFILKVNADVERVADHATSIAKVTQRLVGEIDASVLPTSLRELGERVPRTCHVLLRAMMDRDLEGARALVQRDRTIDTLYERLFDETVDLMKRTPDYAAAGLLIHRAGRELERIGDLMANIAEDVIYLVTGSIVRHATD